MRQSAIGIIVAAFLASACGSNEPQQSSSAGGATAPASAPKTAGAKPQGVVIMGERFVSHVIQDPAQGNMAVGVVVAPATWKFQTNVVWNYANYSNPVESSMQAENPANTEAVYGYPALVCFDLNARGYYQPGMKYGGLIYAQRRDPATALALFVQQTRGAMPNLHFVGSKDLPDLPAALKMPDTPKGQRGIGVKVTYDLNGAPVEEEFYGVWYSIDIPYDGPQGRTWQNNWGLAALHSFRAPAGTLDKRRPVFTAMARSFRPNPAWQQRLAAVNAYLAEQFNRQLQAGYDAIAAAGQLSRQISANNDAMIAAIDQRLQASRTTAAASPEARSAADKFDDYIRGVETVDDPYYGTSQQTANAQFHWTDGYGNYRQSNDGTYDPNRTEVGQWQQMRPIR